MSTDDNRTVDDVLDDDSDVNHEPSDDARATDGNVPIVIITVVQKKYGKITKTIKLDADGNVKSNGEDCLVSAGYGRRVQINGVAGLVAGLVAGFAAVINNLKDNEVICPGRLRADLPDNVEIIKANKINDKTPHNVIARTQEYFVYEDRQPAPVLFDYDTKYITQPIAERVRTNGYAALPARSRIRILFWRPGTIRR